MSPTIDLKRRPSPLPISSILTASWASPMASTMVGEFPTSLETVYTVPMMSRVLLVKT